jgi:proteasome lid subunit RPN8/RPN11
MLPAGLRDKMIAHARAAYPNEGCGLFAGSIEAAKPTENDGGDSVKTVCEVYCLKNIDESPTHFSMSPEEQFAAIADMRKKNLALLGNFHSHPSTPSRPSPEDMRLAFDAKLSYIIISLADAPDGGQEIVKSFIIKKDAQRYTEETLTIV